MKTILILIILIIMHPMISFSKINEIKSYAQLDSLWDTYKENDQFSFTHGNYILLKMVKLSDFFYYRKLSNYLDRIFEKDMKLIRIINAQNYGFYWNFPKCDALDYFFTPDVCFLYKMNKSNQIHLVYYDKLDMQIVDTIPEFFNFNFDYLLQNTNYKGLKFVEIGLTMHIGSYKGTGISLSVYNNKKVFVWSIPVFWRNYSDGLRIDFFNDEVKGKKVTIKKLQKLLISLRTYIEFEDYPKDRVKEEKLIENCLEYKMKRDTFLDVNALEQRKIILNKLLKEYKKK